MIIRSPIVVEEGRNQKSLSGKEYPSGFFILKSSRNRKQESSKLPVKEDYLRSLRRVLTWRESLSRLKGLEAGAMAEETRRQKIESSSKDPDFEENASDSFGESVSELRLVDSLEVNRTRVRSELIESDTETFPNDAGESIQETHQ